MTMSTDGIDLRVLCIVRNFSSNNSDIKKTEIILDGTRKVSDLFEEVGDRFEYESSSFQLILQKRSDGVSINLDQHLNQTLENTGFSLSLESRNQVQIEDKNGKPPRKKESADTSQSNANPSYGLRPSTSLPMLTNGPSNYPSYLNSPTGFVGLVNQAMTCYLNSLLQTLYMTPEFRNALYQWRFDESSEEAAKSIPYQLQKLFLLLQTSQKTAVETTQLTRSFGWDSSEAWQQHDIQELCRVMFDALEHKFKGTEHADLISRLYEGKMTDYLKCLECNQEKAREDTFLDVPLPVRPFGSSAAYSSIEESLKAFVQPETLDGNNQYHCDRCGKKCDAHKGLKFSKFPYLLTLHLKRFDFDYSTLQRIKLNDRVTFPEILDLNSFLKDSKDVSGDTDDCLSEGTDLDDDASHRTHSSKLSDIESQVGEEDEGIDLTSGVVDPERSKRRALESGPYVYELFSIMIHSGSASGGHYYAYIKDFRTGLWSCFNDQSVTRVTPEDIEKSYGGASGRSYYSSAYSSSTNAYMLIYRQIDSSRNTEAITPEQFPEHIKALVKELERKDEEEKSAKDWERNYFRCKLFCFHPQKGKLEDTLTLPKDIVLKDVLQMAYEKLEITDAPIERCRLVTYNDFTDSLESSLDGKENHPVYDIVTMLGSNKYSLLMEMDYEGKGFKKYASGGCTVKLFLVDTSAAVVSSSITHHFPHTTTVNDLIESLKTLNEINRDSVAVIWESSTYLYKMLNKSDKTLKQEGFTRSHKVYMDTSGANVENLKRIVEDYNNRNVMYISVPNVSQEILDRDSIPSLSKYHASASASNLDYNSGVLPCASPQDYLVTEGPPLTRWQPREGELTSDEEVGNISLGSMSPQPASPLNAEDYDLIDVDQDVSSDRRFETGEHSASEDSSLTDSDRTLMGDPPEDGIARPPSPQMSSPSSSHFKIDQVCIQYIFFISNLSNTKQTEYKREEKQIEYKLAVDRRMHLGEMKKNLEPYVNVPCDFFRIFKIQASCGIDRECVNLNESLETFGDEAYLTVRLGRALKPGEIRGKVFHLQPNEAEPVSSNCLFEWILEPGTSVQQVREELWKESQKYGVDVPFERFCVRMKSRKSPAKIFADHETIGNEDIPLYANWEIFVQVCPEDKDARSVPDGCRADNVVTLFTRRWKRSDFVLEAFREITFPSYEIDAIKSKLSLLYNVPVDAVQIAKPLGYFPCDMSLLKIDSDLDWERKVRSIEDSPYSINEDGGILFWRDSRENLKVLTDDERKAMNIKENSRLQRTNTYTTSSYSRKEKALKIYYESTVQPISDIDVD
ncbi:ubiquitin carboxyl-terminal hydrolase 47-like isoform X2 [Artemia franciscana]|uniref:Ubiquitin carboxyl-terminal hydrolase 47 n=2 Tax=Artemia franciscana TaxID=6661 RepID=A0AA88I3N5_ARTSF|nr:hypothetical protein QYM36_004760 [Artemia franciscana]